MSKNKTQTCDNCQYLGTTKLELQQWHVCTFPSIMDTFEDGRYLELKEFPDWCPKPVTKKPSEVKVIIHRALEDDFVRVIHEQTGICEESNLYKSTHKNQEDAMRKLAVRIEDKKDGSEREVEVLTEDGFLGKSAGDE